MDSHIEPSGGPAEGADAPLILLDLRTVATRHDDTMASDRRSVRGVESTELDAPARELAWRFVFRKETLRHVSRCLGRLGVAREDRDDWTQIVMIEAHGSLDSYDAQRGRPDRWLNGIVVRTAWLYHVQARRRRKVLSADEETGEEMADDRPSPEEELLRQEARLKLRRALGALPPDRRQLLTEHDLGQVMISEVARTTGISPFALYSRRRRALSALRAAMAGIEAAERRD